MYLENMFFKLAYNQMCACARTHKHKKNTPDKAQQQWAKLSAAWFNSVRKLVHGFPQQTTKVSKVCAITNCFRLLQLLQKQNTNIPAVDHICPWTQHQPCTFILLTILIIILFLKLFL